MEAQRKLVHYIVGGHPYTLNIADIQKYPESFFARSIDEKWRTTDVPIVIERDGDIFRYVSAFIAFGSLPRVNGKIALDAGTIAAIRQEADFFNLPELMKDCSIKNNAEDKLENFITMRSYIERVKVDYGYEDDICVYPTKKHYLSACVDALSTVWEPFCVRGKQCAEMFFPDLPLLKLSTIGALNVPELLAECEQSAFGKGTATVLDPAVRTSWEMSAAKLDQQTLDQLATALRRQYRQLAPHCDVELRPYKLVIYQEGGHFDAHRDTVRGEGHIGTLVLILNSDYTGGELEITHNGQTEVVTGPYSWVAMYGDCLHKINPVTSGVRVSLIFDIYATPKKPRRGGDAFWSEDYYSQASGKVRKFRGVTEGIRQVIFDGVNRALEESEEVIICLAHKYPLQQTTPAYLKGGDKALYRLLREAFTTQVVACTVVHHGATDYLHDRVTADLFTLYSPPAEDSEGSVDSAGGSGAGDAGNEHGNDPEDEEGDDSEMDYDDGGSEGNYDEYYDEEDDVYDDEEGEDEEEDEDPDEEQVITSDVEEGEITQAFIAPRAAPLSAFTSAATKSGKRRPQLVIIPTSLNPDSVLDYSPYIDHVGNESQSESTVYLVAGLQLRRREV